MNLQEIKDQLIGWINLKKGNEPVFQEGVAPHGGKTRAFALTSCPLVNLKFDDHKFNPRTPNQGKVHELMASISVLTLLTPLTCVFIPSDKTTNKEGTDETVFLLDGRHRFEALLELAKTDSDWEQKAKVDLKIYYGLQASDVYMLATYLNKTRKSLAKGEYYKFIAKIYDSKYDEIVRSEAVEPDEIRVFKDISSRELTSKNFDLSIGRIVGYTAFDPEQDGSWYPMVGLKQQDKIDDPKAKGKFCPITAGNMATFLRHLCSEQPYGKKDMERRSVEIGNVLTLGEYFRKIILHPVDSYEEATGTTVSCKHWPLDALGSLIESDWSSELLNEGGSGYKLLAHDDIKWERFSEILHAYYHIMSDQAIMINNYRSSENISELREAWSYQTQTLEIIRNLKPLMKNKLNWLKG